jgi:hypothetical protein
MEIVVVVLLALALAGAGYLGYRHWRRLVAERQRLRRIGAIAYEMIRDVLLPDGNEGQIHVDFVLLTGAGLLVVDLRDVPGIIFGGEQMDDWAVMHGATRTTFKNPLARLYDRIAIVQQIAGKVPVDGRVVFTPAGSFPRGRPKRVVMLDGLAEEFPAADPKLEPSPVTPWSEGWARLREAAVPSPAPRMR